MIICYTSTLCPAQTAALHAQQQAEQLGGSEPLRSHDGVTVSCSALQGSRSISVRTALIWMPQPHITTPPPPDLSNQHKVGSRMGHSGNSYAPHYPGTSQSGYAGDSSHHGSHASSGTARGGIYIPTGQVQVATPVLEPQPWVGSLRRSQPACAQCCSLPHACLAVCCT